MSLAHVNARCAYAQPIEKKANTTTAEIIVNQNTSYFSLPAPAPLLVVSTIEIPSLCTRLASLQLSLLRFGHNIFNAKIAPYRPWKHKKYKHIVGECKSIHSYSPWASKYVTSERNLDSLRRHLRVRQD